MPVDLVIDHSVQVDYFGTDQALDLNVELEFERNRERYEFLRWGQKAFDNFRVVPPGTGIVHQVNLEYLAKCVFLRDDHAGKVAVPDSLVGTDSHTTMINGLGVVGWGVGGIEAEAVMLGQPIYMLMPEVVGFKLTGALRAGATATDLVLTVTQILRKHGVVDKFVEFFGDGVSTHVAGRPRDDRQHGARVRRDDGLLPRRRRDAPLPAPHRPHARTKSQLVERYAKEQGLFRTDATPAPTFTTTVELDLATVEPSLAGPKRPQDRVPLADMKAAWRRDLLEVYRKVSPESNGPGRWEGEGGQPAEAGAARPEPAAVGIDPGSPASTCRLNGKKFPVQHGGVVIAAITSCTNTSNPSVMIAAGLLAKKAVEKGLTVPPYVKTSLAPGSRVVTDYFEKAGLEQYLDKLGFNTVGYGCTTCIGNSGPLPEPIAKAVNESDLVVAGVLSGNRNFEGRINPHVKANYLASPPLVVAYALAGTTDIDLDGRAARHGRRRRARVSSGTSGRRTRRCKPSSTPACCPRCSSTQYDNVWQKNEKWNAIEVTGGELYEWDDASTYIQEPPFLVDLSARARPDPADHAAPAAGGGRRLGDDRPHLAGRLDRQGQPRRQVPDGARRRAGRLQQLRRPPRQRPRDDPRHVRQHPHPQPAGPRHRRGRHAAPARRRGDDASTTPR